MAGRLRLIFSFAESREYMDELVLAQVPRSPPWLLGVFGTNGLAVPLVDLDAWAHNTQPRKLARYRALRLEDGMGAWAIALNAAPSVVALGQSRSQAVSTRLPISVASTNGHLMPHIASVWTLQDGSFASQVRWPAVFQSLKQDLSGAITN
ncbi:MAG: hypothetical protein CFE39_03660 [Comamonadaceae bacterium PBBC2]|nr:MAG: hypothetical protein CFE39_03660 [Comamonadaceae bacterium PBBC2]